MQWHRGENAVQLRATFTRSGINKSFLRFVRTRAKKQVAGRQSAVLPKTRHASSCQGHEWRSFGLFDGQTQQAAIPLQTTLRVAEAVSLMEREHHHGCIRVRRNS